MQYVLCLVWDGLEFTIAPAKQNLCCPARSIIIACLQITKGPFSQAAFQPSSPIRALLLGKGSDHYQHIATLLAQVRRLGQRLSDSQYLSKSSLQWVHSAVMLMLLFICSDSAKIRAASDSNDIPTAYKCWIYDETILAKSAAFCFGSSTGICSCCSLRRSQIGQVPRWCGLCHAVLSWNLHFFCICWPSRDLSLQQCGKKPCIWFFDAD